MPRVALIVTGRLERDGLPSALERLFPEVEFASEPVGGFTSSRVTVAPAQSSRPASILTNAEKMAEAMMLALDPGRASKSGTGEQKRDRSAIGNMGWQGTHLT